MPLPRRQIIVDNSPLVKDTLVDEFTATFPEYFFYHVGYFCDCFVNNHSLVIIIQFLGKDFRWVFFLIKIWCLLPLIFYLFKHFLDRLGDQLTDNSIKGVQQVNYHKANEKNLQN